MGSEKSHTCEGDSGGPAVDSSTGELVGIPAWGPLGGCSDHAPTVFTNVINYRQWILNQMILSGSEYTIDDESSENKYASDLKNLVTFFNITHPLVSRVFNIG